MSPADDPDPDPDLAGPDEDIPRMTLAEHLNELRSRAVRSIVAVVVGMIVAFVFHRDVFRWATGPFREAVAELGKGGDLQALSPLDTFVQVMKLAFLAALVATSPYVLWQMWGFVGAGLYRHERRVVRLFFPVSLVFFVLGCLMAYLVFLPIALRFLLGFGQGLEVRNDFAVGDYLSFCLSLLLGFGVAFQTPLLMLFLQATGIVERATLAKGWRIATLIAFVVAMVLTPDPSPVSQLLMAVPLVGLYLLGVYGGRFVGEGRTRFRIWHAWPLALLLLALAALFWFRRDLTAFASGIFS